jgi:hypothetical protein
MAAPTLTSSGECAPKDTRDNATKNAHTKGTKHNLRIRREPIRSILKHNNDPNKKALKV